MKEQIIIYYKKDKLHPNNYIVKTVLSREDIYYSVKTYYMINGKLKEFSSRLKLHDKLITKYLFQCKKSVFFKHIEFQYIMEGI